ncbi:hypothetical protein [Herbaspirillum sp. NPDC087042]|uniref:hypothetical protein n=1 Tax=Herbaspirillum sp. NPDC087042 TaxID=3364004 RepID=UPI003825DA05
MSIFDNMNIVSWCSERCIGIRHSIAKSRANLLVAFFGEDVAASTRYATASQKQMTPCSTSHRAALNDFAECPCLPA